MNMYIDTDYKACTDVYSRKSKIIIQIISMLIWLMLTAACMYSALNVESLSIKSGEIVVFTFHLFPYLILGGLYGYVISLFSFTLTFITKLVLDMDNAYSMVIYMVAIICFSMFSQYFYFASKKKTLLSAIVSLIFISFATMSCLTIIASSEYELEQVVNFVFFFARDFMVMLVCAFGLHLFFTKAPDICKVVFPLGMGYTKAFQDNKEVQRSLRKTKVSVKITIIIIAVELILGIAVAVFMMVLFPDIKNIVTDSIDNQISVENSVLESQNIEEVSADDSEVTESVETRVEEKIVSLVQNMDFQFGNSVLSFDLKMILLMLCIGVPMAAFANFYTKMTIGGPLGVMSDFMYDFANADDERKPEVGRRVDKIQVKTHDEIEVVYESMKSTVYSIDEYIRRIKAEKELEKELEVAQKASEAKSSFLSNMSHEIRTPINAVLGMNEMIIRESKDEQITEYAQNVKSAGNSLLGIINDILDFSKIEAGKMEILPVKYHLGSMINDLVNMINIKASDKGLDLEINVDKTLPTTLMGDEVRIKQCVTNVLTNAVKYTEKGSVTMNVSYKKEDEDSILLRFQVVDTGIGIKEEDLGKLFSPFERIEEIRNRTIEGTGLGMSIVKKLLALMDTRLEVHSVYGQGSDFSFEVKQKVISWEELGDLKQKYKEYLQSLTRYREKFRAPQAQILVVDDTAMNLTVVKGLLKSTQIKIDTAESGKETLEKVKLKKYDAIFIDHRMPEMDGIETLAAMKELEGNLNTTTVCIALTANAGAGAREEYIEAGFDDYLSKPVNGEKLEDMLKQYLPKEKILLTDDEELEEEAAGAIDSNEDEDFLNELEGVDLAEAVKNCGSRDILKEVVKDFLISIDSKADNIEKYASEKDYRNFTVAVHALKSSARLIGALELSEDAAYMEKCGNEEDEARIATGADKLVADYRSYKDKLKAAADNKSDDLPAIDADEFESAISDMKELLEAYDFDTADGIMNMLSGYKIPDIYQDKYNKIKKLMAAVDRDGLLSIL